jgi:hypothetical protein
MYISFVSVRFCICHSSCRLDTSGYAEYQRQTTEVLLVHVLPPKCSTYEAPMTFFRCLLDLPDLLVFYPERELLAAGNSVQS